MTEQQGRSSGRTYSLGGVLLVFSVPAIGGCLFGFDIGATSYAIVQMASSLEESGVAWWSVVDDSPFWKGFIVSAASLGAFLGSVLIYDWADILGRKRELQIGSVLYMCGALLEAGAGSYQQYDSEEDVEEGPVALWPLGILLLGRLIYGIGIGITMHAAPTYLAEMGPTSIRGLLVAMKEASIVLGILLGYVLGAVYSNISGGWVYTYASSLVLSTSMLGLSFFIPYSCRWLLLKQRNDEALESLRFVLLPEYAQDEFDSMLQGVSQQEEREDSQSEGLIQDESIGRKTRNLSDPSVRGPLLAGIGLVFLQQVTGQPSILSYAAGIFKDAGLSGDASIIVAVFKLVATCASAIYVEKYGRKWLLYVGTSLMLAALCVLTVTYGASNEVFSLMILFAMLLYIGGYQVGFGPITWLIVSEVFPLDVRGQAIALGGQINFGLNALVQFIVPVLESFIGLNVTFGIFAGLCGYSLYFVNAYVLETKGLSLEEIEMKFEAQRMSEQPVEAMPITNPRVVV